MLYLQVIYVARNPKDVAVSFYHLNRLYRTQGYIGDFAKYWDYFERNLSNTYIILLSYNAIFLKSIWS